MVISYKWISEYLPEKIDAERLSKILTSIGLEVETKYAYESVKGSLEGLVIGEVLTLEKHPNADSLSLTTVNIGQKEPLQIVCGAKNVAVGQKVVVAPVGATIYPAGHEPITMKVAKIRKIDSYGMICAEDEIGLGTSHEGIMTLDAEAAAGMAAAKYFKPYDDIIYEIGLTPNRMDAMSHLGVARDVCAYLAHHDNTDAKPKSPINGLFKNDNENLQFDCTIQNEAACLRYSGLSIENITIAPSPDWMQNLLKAIGIRPINNVVDITNYILHETGQPLHAFDADKIPTGQIVIGNVAAGTKFITLDEKERTLADDDLMICRQAEDDTLVPMCIAGIFGGLDSGISRGTKNIFLESACFNPVAIRKTAIRHGLRTDASQRFEKGTDIAATVNVLKRAAGLIKEICGGKLSSAIIDKYPAKNEKTEITLKYHYLKKLSGKNYHPDSITKILTCLGFEIVKDSMDELRVAVPFHKPDISIPADLVEEILRIDGLDNVAIPESITISPSTDENTEAANLKEKIASSLVGLGFSEIITNSITNAAYYTDDEKKGMAPMLNSLSAELNILRGSMIESSLECVARNLNQKNNTLRLFEFGKSYHVDEKGVFFETEHLAIILTGKAIEKSWNEEDKSFDIYYLKGIVIALLQAAGIKEYTTEPAPNARLENYFTIQSINKTLAECGTAQKKLLTRFDIKQPVFFAQLNWNLVSEQALGMKHSIKELPKYPSVQRDLAIVLDKQNNYSSVLENIYKANLKCLKDVKLFDVFESEKLGQNKKSLAVSFTFQDEEKTLTDTEIEKWMEKIISILEKEMAAEIRK